KGSGLSKTTLMASAGPRLALRLRGRGGRRDRRRGGRHRRGRAARCVAVHRRGLRRRQPELAKRAGVGGGPLPAALDLLESVVEEAPEGIVALLEPDAQGLLAHVQAEDLELALVRLRLAEQD